jgi:hypothetical protein
VPRRPPLLAVAIAAAAVALAAPARAATVRVFAVGRKHRLEGGTGTTVHTGETPHTTPRA